MERRQISACCLTLILLAQVMLVKRGSEPLGHLQRADANDHPASERVRVDRTHGPAGRPKQTKLSKGIRAHPFRSQIWARNASARTARASSRAPLLVRPGPSRQRLQAISPSPPLCFPPARAPPPFRRRRRHAHRRRPLAAPDRQKAAPDRQKEAPPSTAPRRRPRPPPATR
jgi:hypothetical protein